MKEILRMAKFALVAKKLQVSWDSLEAWMIPLGIHGVDMNKIVSQELKLCLSEWEYSPTETRPK